MARRELDIALALWALILALALGAGSLVPWRLGWPLLAGALDAGALLFLGAAAWLLVSLPPARARAP